jgi:hypothetical protein
VESGYAIFDLLACDITEVEFFLEIFWVVGVRSGVPCADYFPYCARSFFGLCDEVQCCALCELLLWKFEFYNAIKFLVMSNLLCYVSPQVSVLEWDHSCIGGLVEIFELKHVVGVW